jgi:hypothetical protein
MTKLRFDDRSGCFTPPLHGPDLSTLWHNINVTQYLHLFHQRNGNFRNNQGDFDDTIVSL